MGNAKLDVLSRANIQSYDFMTIKVENQSGIKLPRNFTTQVERILEILPREHTIGLERIIFIDVITQPQMRNRLNVKLPGLYYPKQATKPAFIEISTQQLAGTNEPFHKRIILRLSFKNNLAGLLISLVGQHYYSTLRHSIKRGQMEPAIRGYSEKYIRLWSQHEHRLRAKIFKPLEPTLDRWARKMRNAVAKQRVKP
ncbi:MAG: hypothetical protein QOE33_2755 [Acidobacteriota bacterium]|nr:hypothetical protein [Acidobacteriota bacterium]